MTTEAENRMKVLNHFSPIPLISTGQPSTLGTYKELAVFFGPKAEAFIDKKIAEATKGKDEEVIAEETQMLYLLANIGAETDD